MSLEILTLNRWMWDHLEDMQRKAEHYKRKFVKGHQVTQTFQPPKHSTFLGAGWTWGPGHYKSC